ncbi:hypothetical protein caldi_26420 [Caldinitratiruptor microaerophilus]|uniref:Uncharacterized protein n=1 Tax=Caldinitratiruptor microaerophilus TaxID=671077 RepID=A0AA35CLX1_9FIRM|nr:hypothetical protein caldi_26420 [Caldinitratiruptor microaerophilus]
MQHHLVLLQVSRYRQYEILPEKGLRSPPVALPGIRQDPQGSGKLRVPVLLQVPEKHVDVPGWGFQPSYPETHASALSPGPAGRRMPTP